MNRLTYIRTWMCSMRRNLSTPVPSSAPPPPSAGPERLTPKYRPSDFQKIILVWTKKYKNKAEIPDFVSPDLIERSRSEARIKIANVLMLLTALASLGAILSGKAAAKRGETISHINQEFHQQYKDNYDKEQAAIASNQK